MGPLIVNIDSTELSKQECALLENELIGGVLLFDHNYVDKIQADDLIKSIKNINDKLVLITDKGGRYFLNDRTVSQIMKKQMDGDLESTEQHDDDYDETQDLTTAKSATLKIVKGDVK